MDQVTESQVQILQGALSLELEGIAAYRIAGQSGLLSPGALKSALVFMSHHEQHRDSIATVIGKLGATPVGPLSDGDYAAKLKLGALKSEIDVLKLALQLERGAAHGYSTQVVELRDPRIAQLFARIACDESVHWTALNLALGDSISNGAYLFD